MVNKIFGVIRDSARGGMPLRDLRIRVWDRDWPDGDDLMGEAFTAADGRYEVYFHGDGWDQSLGIFDLGRPDIYITAESQTSTAKWVRLAESEVHSNHDINEDLRIDLDIAVGETVSRQTGFLAEVHGFHFINSFLVAPDLLGVNLGNWNMGFCGGMCSGALYRYRRNLPVPLDTVAPLEGSLLHLELMRRQVKAMSPKMLPKMFEWQGSADTDQARRKKSLAERTRAGWPELQETLDSGAPAIIVLIRSTGLLGNPTDNHQVLVIGYHYNPLTMALVLNVYDPNIPDRAQVISGNLGLPGGSLDLVDSASHKTRGFFLNPVAEEAISLEI